MGGAWGGSVVIPVLCTSIDTESVVLLYQCYGTSTDTGQGGVIVLMLHH